MPQPNIILILIDDLGWMDLGCYGSGFYETPNLDGLAAGGVRFTNAYAAAPVCSPTRASILTGKYPATVQITDWIGGESRGRLLSAPYLRAMPHTETTLAAALRQGGYQTWHVGKWHLGPEASWPQHHGFDVNVGGWDAGAPRSYYSPYANPMLTDGPRGEYLTDRLTDEAIRLIRQSDGRPFFLNLWHYAVHTPIHVPDRYAAKYREKAARLGLDRQDPFVLGENFPCEHKREQRVCRRVIQSDPAYAGMVANLDENIGRLLAALEELGLAGNTIVIFTSDNGGLATSEGSPTCNAPLSEGKGWMYEGGTREPLIVRWPGRVDPGSLCHSPVTSPDFYPTLLELAGLDPMPAQHCDGVSFAPLLSGKKDGGEDAARAFDRGPIFWHYPHYGNQGGRPGCSIRSGRHKLIRFFEDDHVELYDLQSDIGEKRDLSREEPALAADLEARLRQWLQDRGAKVPKPNPSYRP